MPRIVQDIEYKMSIISIGISKWVALDNDQSGHVSSNLFCLSFAVAHMSDRNPGKISKG